MSIQYQLFPEKLSYDIVSGLNQTGYPKSVPREKMEEIGNAIARISLTEEIHPMSGLKIACHNLELLNKMYVGEISEDKYVSMITNTKNIAPDASAYELLPNWMCFAFVSFYCLALMLGKSFQDTIVVLDEYDNWGDLAISGTDILAGNRWDFANLIHDWNFPDDMRYIRWEEFYGDNDE